MLGDVVGPAVAGLRMRGRARAGARRRDRGVPAEEPPAGVAVGDGIVVLDRVHRYGGDIARLAAAVRAGDADDAVALLDATPDDAVDRLPIDAASGGAGRSRAAARAGRRRRRRRSRGGRAGDAATALDALAALPAPVRAPAWPARRATWMAQVESVARRRSADFASEGPWYVGRPLLVTENDYPLRLYNGDTGVVVQTEPGASRRRSSAAATSSRSRPRGWGPSTPSTR